ncbi:MAG: flagellar biosynthesis repressor FlbT [Neomegalonema sp.]|nr:flagellar biosynthesis repressor FlbT [Neomegalonema sp.]
MSGLVLKLGPQERVLINGVVMENGDRKTSLTIKTPGAAVLRLRDALHPDDVKTPVTRAYYTAQLAVAGEVEEAAAAAELNVQLDALADVFESTAQSEVVEIAVKKLRERNFYYVMRTLRPLIEIEREMFALLNQPASAAYPQHARA